MLTSSLGSHFRIADVVSKREIRKSWNNSNLHFGMRRDFQKLWWSKEVNVRLFISSELGIHVFTKIEKLKKHTPRFYQFVILNVAFKIISGDSWNCSLYFKFFIKWIRIHCFPNSKLAKLGTLEDKEVFNVTWGCSNGINRRTLRLSASRSDKCCLHNFKVNVPEVDMDVPWSSESFWGFFFLSFSISQLSIANFLSAQRETIQRVPIISVLEIPWASLMHFTRAQTVDGEGNWYFLSF